MTGNKENATPLCIYHNVSEFHTISNIRTFFGVKEYCFSCLMPYDRKSNHKCGALCLNCRRVGQKIGIDHLCAADGSAEKWRISQMESAQNLNAVNAELYGIRKQTQKKSEKDTFVMIASAVNA